MRFKDKIVFITGGAVGFGRAFGEAFAAEGARIAIADISMAEGECTARRLRDGGSSALALHCDVAKEQEVDCAVAAAIAEFGGIDILINNAGLHLTKYNQPFSLLPRTELRKLLEVNVLGVVNCTIACRNTMRARGGGAVLNIASIAGYLSTTPYGISKLAVRGLTVAFANEFAGDGIRVNAVAPGLIGTENALDDLPRQFVDDFVENRQLLHRLGATQDIVAAVLYLCSEDASFITGETIKISGGYPLSL